MLASYLLGALCLVMGLECHVKLIQRISFSCQCCQSLIHSDISGISDGNNEVGVCTIDGSGSSGVVV